MESEIKNGGQFFLQQSNEGIHVTLVYKSIREHPGKNREKKRHDLFLLTHLKKFALMDVKL